jgi:hypothetical protein
MGGHTMHECNLKEILYRLKWYVQPMQVNI